MIDHPPRVFISYAQESAVHSAWVLALARRLRDDGVDVVIDQYCQWPERGWRGWMSEQIAQAQWVLVVCTEEYRKRFDNNAPADVGRGVRYESQHITQALYDAKFRNLRFVPLLPPSGDKQHIPFELKDYRSFCLDDEYEALYRLLTEQAATPQPVLGTLRRLPSLAVPVFGALLLPTTVPSPATPPRPLIRNPYPGLAAFRPEEGSFFFGRDEDSARVLQQLEKSRLVSVVGGSGTGKSSLVAAGVVPKLRQRDAALSYLRFKPQSDPFRQLAEALDRRLPEKRLLVGGPRVERIRQALAADQAKAIAGWLGQLSAPIVLFADQFEELFTQTPLETARRFRALLDTLRAQEGVSLLLTLRSEFMPRLMDWLGGELFKASLAPLDPITDEARLRAIIVRPAEASGVAVEAGLLAELLPTAGAMAGALPLLALMLAQLFDQRDGAKGLTLAAYQRMGGLPRVVETAAAPIDDEIDTSPDLAHACERLFSELATVVDELPTRRSAEVEVLRALPGVGTLVDALRAQGLLADHDPQHVELAHETLLGHWPRLRQWCAQYSDKLSLRRQAELAASDWEKTRNKDESSGDPATLRRSNLLRWTWERQKPALVALLALNHLDAPVDGDFADAGIDAWRALQGGLSEPLASFLDPEPLRLLAELASDETAHHRREEIGLRLNQMGDPRRGVGLDAAGLPDIVWVDIPAGEVTLESEPPTTFSAAAFRIARYPITWRQYRAFVDAAEGYRDPRWWDELKHEDEAGEARWAFANYPAINVSWYDAVAFCRWLSDRLGLSRATVIRLPTEWEWQWVAQAGAEAREYPWPGGWHPMRVNGDEGGVGRTTAVGMYPLGVFDEWPVMDLLGNVWEWCVNPYDDPRNRQPGAEVPRVLRGGAWDGDAGDCRAAGRDDFAPGLRLNLIGFRVCQGPIDPLGAAPLNSDLLAR